MQNTKIVSKSVVEDVRLLISKLISTKMFKTIEGPKRLNSILGHLFRENINITFQLTLNVKINTRSMESLMRRLVNFQSQRAGKLIYVGAVKKLLPWFESIDEIWILSIGPESGIATRYKKMTELDQEIQRAIKNVEKWKIACIKYYGSIENAVDKDRR